MDCLNLTQDLTSRFAQQNFEKLKVIERKIDKVIGNAQKLKKLKKSSKEEEKLLKSMLNAYLAFKHCL